MLTHWSQAPERARARAHVFVCGVQMEIVYLVLSNLLKGKFTNALRICVVTHILPYNRENGTETESAQCFSMNATFTNSWLLSHIIVSTSIYVCVYSKRKTAVLDGQCSTFSPFMFTPYNVIAYKWKSDKHTAVRLCTASLVKYTGFTHQHTAPLTHARIANEKNAFPDDNNVFQVNFLRFAKPLLRWAVRLYLGFSAWFFFSLLALLLLLYAWKEKKAKTTAKQYNAYKRTNNDYDTKRDIWYDWIFQSIGRMLKQVLDVLLLLLH